jgi:hypothetical protein
MKRPKEQLFVFALLFMACKFIYGPAWDVIVLPRTPKAIAIVMPKPPVTLHKSKIKKITALAGR